jgi:glycosyltransferase involved in cell wall biosynthesis
MENYALQLIQAMQRRGHETLTVAATWDGLPPPVAQAPVPLAHLPSRGRVFSVPIVRRSVKELEQFIAVHDADVVLAHTPVPGVADAAVRAADKFGIPSVLIYQNDLQRRGLIHAGAVAAYERLIGRRTLRLADRIVVSNRPYADSSVPLQPHLAKVRVVPPGIDGDLFHPAGSPVALPDGRAPFVFVGQLEAETAHKGLGVLLRALATVPEASLVVVGKGTAKGQFEDAARTLGIAERVRFAGYVASAELPRLYSEAQALVLPSTTRAEGFGMVLLEAQACGTPVIACRIGGMPAALAEGRTGLLVRPADVEALADAMRRLQEPSFRAVLAAQARPFVLDGFDWDRSAAILDDVIHEVA